MTHEEIETMKSRADAMRAKKPQLRFGQAMMIALKGVNETSFDAISGTDADPFYDDRKISEFLTTLEKV